MDIDLFPIHINHLLKKNNQKQYLEVVRKVLDKDKSKTLTINQRNYIRGYLIKYDIPSDLRTELWI